MKSVVVYILAFFLSICAIAQEKISITDDIQLIHLSDSIFIHVSWHSLPEYGRFSSNGLIVIKNGKALMVDTPMDTIKTKQLYEYLRDSMMVEVSEAIVCHFHDDCVGGMEYLQRQGVKSYANSRTIAKCKELGLPVPSNSFDSNLDVDFNGELLSCRYFGGGHTEDNITVYVNDHKILFGGCMVKSVHSQSLGNLSDAVVSEWLSTLQAVKEHFNSAEVVVPGHGDTGNLGLIEHTMSLVELEMNK